MFSPHNVTYVHRLHSYPVFYHIVPHRDLVPRPLPPVDVLPPPVPSSMPAVIHFQPYSDLMAILPYPVAPPKNPQQGGKQDAKKVSTVCPDFLTDTT
jgi:hypothetical protein